MIFPLLVRLVFFCLSAARLSKQSGSVLTTTSLSIFTIRSLPSGNNPSPPPSPPVPSRPSLPTQRSSSGGKSKPTPGGSTRNGSSESAPSTSLPLSLRHLLLYNQPPHPLHPQPIPSPRLDSLLPPTFCQAQLHPSPPPCRPPNLLTRLHSNRTSTTTSILTTRTQHVTTASPLPSPPPRRQQQPASPLPSHPYRPSPLLPTQHLSTSTAPLETSPSPSLHRRGLEARLPRRGCRAS
jgi:hypothetical protein